ncbi:hypothetical protein [Neobacillus cucumis]|uniref:Uncharacterized protein n=1 Tax=Neobacillus cucumis TaxID=1740721 RepID=A0A2N5HC51_9BACI|nr:hypothetical protein [Neobacillus cucumis]PLS03088.1 hypothetical protein CVD27_15600 [Neobacillus cucumis]
MIGGIIIAGIMLAGLAAGVITLVVKNQPKLSKENIPSRLGILDHVPFEPVLNKLNASLDEDYIQQVKGRFLQENPKLTEHDFEWWLFELKRYFLLSNILKITPMFSKEVDEVWHTMILFTQKYQIFSERFLGQMLHHTPNIHPEPAPQERAFFDWAFSQLFQVTKFSWKTWGSFFKYPVDTKLLKEFNESSIEALKEKYFKVNEDNKELIEYLVSKMKKQLSEAEVMYQVDKKGRFTRISTYGEMTSLSLVMVFFSYYYFDEYWNYAKLYAFANPGHYTSGCTTAVFCGSSSTDHHHGDGGSSHSSCSSSSCSSSNCSSCGSGCSS